MARFWKLKKFVSCVLVFMLVITTNSLASVALVGSSDGYGYAVDSDNHDGISKPGTPDEDNALPKNSEVDQKDCPDTGSPGDDEDSIENAPVIDNPGGNPEAITLAEHEMLFDYFQYSVNGVSGREVGAMENSEYAQLKYTQYSSNRNTQTLFKGIFLTTNTGTGQWILSADEEAAEGKFLIYVKTGSAIRIVEITIEGIGSYIIGDGGGSDSVNTIKVGPYDKPPDVGDPTGQLTVTKLLIGSEVSDGTFIIVVYDKDGQEVEQVEIATENGMGTALIDELPYGEYTVFEQGSDSEDFPYDVEIPNEGKVTVGSETAVVFVTNIPKEIPEILKGSLTINKVLQGSEAEDDTFTIIVYDKDGEEAGQVSITTENGSGTAVIEDLPYGEYTVFELDSDSEDFPYDVEISNEGEVTVGSVTALVIVTNTPKEVPKVLTGSLTINKVLQGDEAEDDTFTIILYDKNGDEAGQVSITTENGSGTAVIENLPYGEYTVFEQDSDCEDFPYTVSIDNEGCVTLDSENQEITVYNTVEDALPVVRLNITKQVKDPSGAWVNSASFNGASLNAEFMITVSLDISELLAYNEKHETQQTAYAGGMIKDLLDGNAIPLENGGEFRLYYVDEDDYVLSMAWYVKSTVAIGNHLNVAYIEQPWSDFLGELVLTRESDSASVQLASVSGGGPSGSGSTGSSSNVSSTIVYNPIPLNDLRELDWSEPPQEIVELEDTIIPLSDLPEDEPVTDPKPEVIVVEYAPVPLSNLPKTGVFNSTYMWLMGLCASIILAALPLKLFYRKAPGEKNE